MYDAYDYFLHTLCTHHVLFLTREDDTFVLQTDASYRGIGAVLSVVRDREERPVDYFSKKLLPAERNYSASELECLAVVRGSRSLCSTFSGTKPFHSSHRPSRPQGTQGFKQIKWSPHAPGDGSTNVQL